MNILLVEDEIGIREGLAAELRSIEAHAPRFPVVSNATAEPVTTGEDGEAVQAEK